MGAALSRKPIPTFPGSCPFVGSARLTAGAFSEEALAAQAHTRPGQIYGKAQTPKDASRLTTYAENDRRHKPRYRYTVPVRSG